MSALAQRPESPRRPPPPPIRISKRTSTLVGGTSPSSETLLYDLPSTIPRSPTSQLPSELPSPTSPTYPGRPRTRTPQKISPRPSRTRSATPSKSSGEIEAFVEHCEKWFFKQDEEAGQAMTQTLATLPAHQRAPYVKLQASIRSAFHSSVRARRDAEFQAHLSATVVGGSLSARARTSPRGTDARKERHERFSRFVHRWCTAGMPGTKPFFEGLWAIMRLQVVPESLGGAGARRIEWEIDDAVFKESAGKDFTLEAIDVLKGVLGFEEQSLNRTSTIQTDSSQNFYLSTSASTPIALHARAQSQPLEPISRPGSPPTLAKRSRAPSDPFLDTPVLSRSVASRASSNTLNENSQEEPMSPKTLLDLEMTSSFTSKTGGNAPTTPAKRRTLTYASPLPPPTSDPDEYLRTWLSPDLGNPELLSLIAVFPPFISRRTLPRFPAHSYADEEQGVVPESVRVGTGRMWVSSQTRGPGWQGSWWIRLKLWLRRILFF